MLLYTSRVTIVAVFAAAQLLQLVPGGVSQEPAGPVWAGLSVDELFAEYGAIFGPNGNRNAASHLWSTFVLERAWQLPEAFVLELFRAFCPVSGSPVSERDGNRYQMTLAAGPGGATRTGMVHYCCSPCVCDSQDFIKMDTKTIATADGPSTQWMAVIGNPCAQPGVLDDPFVSPFDGGSYTLAQRAPSLACTADGGLVGATLSDHGEVIIGMFQDTFETKEESAAHAAGQGLAFQDGASADFTSGCADRATGGYASGMGEIFRRVADVTPVGWSATSPPPPSPSLVLSVQVEDPARQPALDSQQGPATAPEPTTEPNPAVGGAAATGVSLLLAAALAVLAPHV